MLGFGTSTTSSLLARLRFFGGWAGDEFCVARTVGVGLLARLVGVGAVTAESGAP